MLGELTAMEIDALLREEFVGRIGCHAEGRTYVVPVTYAYDGRAVYGHTREGLKLRMMRENPYVCFEVDRMRDLSDWESVIAWGCFEPLEGAAAEAGMALLVERLTPHLTGRGSARAPEPHGGAHAHGAAGLGAARVFRLVLSERTGRYEHA